jgi:WD40 repeat protein
VIKVWDVERRSELRVLPEQPDWPMALAMAPDGKRVAVGRYDGSVSLYELDSGRLQVALLKAAPAAPPRAGYSGDTTRRPARARSGGGRR